MVVRGEGERERERERGGGADTLGAEGRILFR